jgi:4'-phosphopantetheinyl transferase
MRQSEYGIGVSDFPLSSDVSGWARLTAVRWMIQVATDVEEGDGWLAPVERETLASLRSEKRQHDWRLGRWTVKQALARLAVGSGRSGGSLAEFVVAAHETGAPYAVVEGRVVPWVLSISHSHDRGLCVFGPAGSSVGCDLERVEPRTDDFTREWFTPSEQEAISSAPTEDRHHMVTLIWSAKESALKAIGAGLTIPTHHVMVTLDGPRPDREWNALFVNRLGEQTAMLGWWRRDAGDLITVVTSPAEGPPIRLNPDPRAV